MITLKIKYTTTEDGLNLIEEYRKQYSSVLRYAYNRRFEDINELNTEHKINSLNNIPLIKSLEEFNIPGEIKDIVKIYNFLKNAKRRYRVSLDELNHLKFSRCFSNKSKVKKILITIHKNT